MGLIWLGSYKTVTSSLLADPSLPVYALTTGPRWPDVSGNVLATGTRVPGTDNTPRELSAREVEVWQLVADGQSNKEIGEALSLSALTVKSHLSRIGRKLGTGDRAQMVALAMRAGVIR